jgi:hypothetical protein
MIYREAARKLVALHGTRRAEARAAAKGAHEEVNIPFS